MGKNYYSSYRPIAMMMQTDVFFNFIEANYFMFKEDDGVSLTQAYDMYKAYCEETLVEFKLPRHKFREELKNYFSTFEDVTRIDGKQLRSYYSGFLSEKFTGSEPKKEEHQNALVLDYEESMFDVAFANCPAQYSSSADTPSMRWDDVTTTLSNIDTHKVHYVKVPENHVVIDFDLKDDKGSKSLERNLDAASKWPATYTEFSKSGSGLHLHYNYDGDVKRLSSVYADGIEVKVFSGKSSLRRKLTKCNNIPIMTINSGLPLKGEKMVNFDAVKSERGLRTLIEQNLRKEIHPGTKPSIDFIFKILDDAHKSGLKYDVTDMRPRILAFANNSSNQPDYCIKLVAQMSFKSEEPSAPSEAYENKSLVFYDVEVFPNLFVVVCKEQGKGKKKIRMINPSPADMEAIMKMMLVGFNCRRYDNHIVYARYIGYNNEQLFQLSQRIINGSNNCMFGEAYNLSYTDIFDYCSVKQSLKKWEIQLRIHHRELGLPWDQPVPEELWETVADYCCDDVDATEATFDATKEDFIARLILAKLSGLSPNHTTQQHTARIIFGTDKRPQDKFVYTDLSEMFPGYKYERGKSTYRGEEVSEGGQVFAIPGMYGNVGLLDIASMHPNSAIALNVFGPYTKRFEELVRGRLAVKHSDWDQMEKLLGGVLAQFMRENPDISLSSLAYALKIAINIVYGLTSAKFDNPFKDPRNIDNIVAKRGALFMIDLKHAVQDKGFVVAHIKTDSIKIPDATPEIIQFVMDFGRKYGYTFEHEATYDKFCLVNDAVYIAKYKDGKHAGEWTATGAQFAQPFVYKTLFSHEPITFEDLCEAKTVKATLFLDMNEGLPPDEHNYHFVGKVGLFCPIKPGCGGGQLFWEKEGKYKAVTGTKGYRWLESEIVKELKKEDDIDHTYYAALADAAKESIESYGDFEWFASEDPYDPDDNGILPF
jgi:hypothetical protein